MLVSKPGLGLDTTQDHLLQVFVLVSNGGLQQDQQMTTVAK